MEIKIPINKAARAAMLKAFGPPPAHPDRIVSEDEWITACAVGRIQYYVTNACNALGVDVEYLGPTMSDISSEIAKLHEDTRKAVQAKAEEAETKASEEARARKVQRAEQAEIDKERRRQRRAKAPRRKAETTPEEPTD